MDIVSQETIAGKRNRSKWPRVGRRKTRWKTWRRKERRAKQVVWCGAQFVLGGGLTTNGSARSMNINIAFFDRDQDSFRPSFLLYFILNLILWGYLVQSFSS
ncbi:hypothetical protein N7453_005355 [Penicillium expansum]|nr:hypothetical protein N7453_005355 [Penicillium expansum]